MDEREFQSVYSEYRDAVYRYARLLTGAPAAAEDITHECFLALYKGGYRSSHGTLKAYLLGAARRMAFKRFRHLERETDLDDSAVAPSTANGGLAPAVAAAVSALPPLQREAVLLFTWEGYTLEEIADMTGVEPGTIKSRLSRARETLRHSLAPYRSYVGGSHGTLA